ncbi:hypothetical protein BGZ98_003265 [Dissophora globulifera]|nr:hypothetical protein BGZ98_003265 [Dissophora globulifera]
MLVNAAQGNHQFNRSSRSTSYHRRSVSCVASHDELTYYPIEAIEEGMATTAIATGDGSSASPSLSRQIPRKSEGISLTQLQRSLSNASGDNVDGVVSIATGSLGGKIKLGQGAPGPRRSLLSDMLSSQNQNNRLEQNAHRRRMIKSMRRYSVDASEMDFNVLHPSGRASPMKGIPSEAEETAAAAGGASGTGPGARQEFRDTPTVRYLRNPCHATVKTKLISASVRRGAGGDNEAPDYFGAEDRVW